MSKTGIYGGTFAPVHNGHIRAAVEFKRQFDLDKLLIMPNAAPPHKEQPLGDSAVHRLNMLKLAFSEYASMGIEISLFELNNKEKNYTADTLRHFSGEDELYFLCGTDMLLTMHKWREPYEIARLCTLVFTRRETRDPETDKLISEQIENLKKVYGFRIEELCMQALEISSTEIRQAADKRLYIPCAVADYIEEHNLYV